jgi:hypothetical protein
MANLFTDLFTNDNEEEAARQKQAGLRLGQTTANTALDAGYNTASGLYDQARMPFSDLFAKGSKGYDVFQDASGVNGVEGVSRVGDVWRSMPGYNAGRDMGINDLERRAAARGNLGGGNTSADTIKFASDYDSTKYKDFLAGLAPNIGVATTGAAGQGQLYGQQAGLAGNVGAQKAGYGYKTETGIGDADAEATMANEKSSSNFWGALLGGASALTKAYGGGTGGLFGGFGGGATQANPYNTMARAGLDF